MPNAHDSDNIAYLYRFVKKYVSKVFFDFLNERSLDYTNNVLFYIGKQYIVFQNIKPLLSKILEILEILRHKHILDLNTFYKLSKEARLIENLISLFYWKAKTGTIIKALNKERTHLYEILAIYRERYGFDIDFDETQFNYLATITYPHLTTTKNPILIMEFNQEAVKRTNRGLHRFRTYVSKFFKDELKDRIKDPKELNKEARKLTDILFRYIKFYEVHKSGHIHVHILLKLPPELVRDFRKLIKLFAGWFEVPENAVDLKYIPKKDRKKVKRYVKKLLLKRYLETSLKHTIDENNELYYLIDKEAFFLNDISRIISHSRNVKIIKKKRKQVRKVRKLTNKKEDKILKEKASRIISVEKIQLPIDFVNYEFARRDVEKFKRLKERREKRRKKLSKEERDRILDTLRKFVRRDEIISKDELKAVAYALDRLNEEIKSLKQYLELIIQAQKKINQMLFEIFFTPHRKPPDIDIEKDNDIDCVDF